MSAKEYRTETLVREIRRRGIAIAGIDKEKVWWWTGHSWTWNQCRDWIEKNRSGIEAAMLNAAEKYFDNQMVQNLQHQVVGDEGQSS